MIKETMEKEEAWCNSKKPIGRLQILVDLLNF